MINEDKLQKLPKWAQEHIEHLQRVIQSQEKEYADLKHSFVGETKTHVKLSRGIREEKDIYLPNDSEVEFEMYNGDVYSIQFDRGWNGERKELRLSQSSLRSSMVIAPSAANVIYIKSVKE